MNTIDYHRMRRALAIVATGLALGGLAGPASGQPMYRMQALGSGGGVPAQAVQNAPVVSNGNCTLSWYGTMGWYTIQGATNLTGPWNNLSSVEATGYAWQTTLPDPDTTNGYSFFQLNQANSYAGSQACGGCHGTQYNTWTATAHAGAYNDLVASHEQNASCVLCHTVGFGQPTGFVSNSPVASLEGVGCEDCHGPAGWHKNSDHAVILPAVSIDPAICGSCHQGHNPQYTEYITSPHYLVEPVVDYGFSGGVYYTNAAVVGGKTLYGYYVTTNSLGAFVTNACSGILNSSFVPGSSVDPGQARQASCGICHSGATRMAMINDYASRLSGVTNALALPIAADAGAWGPACADCHDPHGLNPSPVLGTVTNIIAGVSTNIGLGVVGTNWVQLRNPLWSSNYYTMATVTDARTDSSGNPYYMNTTFASMYNPNVNVCGQCHNTRGARWDGRSYALMSNSVPLTNLIISAAYNYTYTTNYNLYGQIVGIVTNIYPTGGTVTNTVITNVWAFNIGLATNITGFSRAPHLSPQYNMLIGILEPDYLNTTNGSTVYTNSTVNNGIGIYATHSGIKNRSPYNTNQCVTCHVPSYTAASGNVTGHTFEMDPNGCALGGCHTSGYPDWVDYQISTTNTLAGVVDLLNRWSTNNAPALFPGNYSKYLVNSWEYTAPGSLGVPTLPGPSTSDQLLLPTNITQARFDVYMVYSDGSFGVHNPTLIPLLLKDAENKVLSQFVTAKFTANSTTIGANGSVTFTQLNPSVTNSVWNFGDGTAPVTTNSSAIVHQYTTAGTYTVSLTATDNNNNTETLTRNNYINVYVLPSSVSFAYTPGTLTHKVTVNFTNIAVNANYAKWSFYGNSPSLNTTNRLAVVAGMTTSFIYTNAGNYPVVMQASSPAGSVSVTNTITVN